MVDFKLHKMELHLEYLFKPGKVRKKIVRRRGVLTYAYQYTNKYWKRKADRLLARFPNDI